MTRDDMLDLRKSGNSLLDLDKKWLTLREFNNLSDEEKQRGFKLGILKLQDRFGKLGVREGTRILSYEELRTIHSFIMQDFHYVSDDFEFNKSDYWGTEGLMKYIFTGQGFGDCDFAGITMLQMAYWVFGERKDRMYMVACAAETGEGHFVSWHQADDDIYYQIENRVRKPRTVKYMKDTVGYTYWDYASLTNPRKWKKAKQKVMNIIYDTPNNVASDRAEFSISKAIKIHKSKTLLKEWFGVLSGSVVTISSTIKHTAGDVVTTLQANQHNLSQFLDAKYVGILMVVLSIVGIYIRTITDRDIDVKRSYDE